jgi:hypothetical protein
MIDAEYIMARFSELRALTAAAISRSDADHEDGLNQYARNLGYEYDAVMDFFVQYVFENKNEISTKGLLDDDDMFTGMVSVLMRAFEIGLISGRDAAQDPRRARV